MDSKQIFLHRVPCTYQNTANLVCGCDFSVVEIGGNVWKYDSALSHFYLEPGVCAPTVVSNDANMVPCGVHGLPYVVRLGPPCTIDRPLTITLAARKFSYIVVATYTQYLPESFLLFDF